MASSSARPHRQARSGVSYRDPHYDYGGNISFCRRPRSSPTPAIAKKGNDPQYAVKKNLALNPAKNRANAKERAEAVQLQRAINESLSQRSSEKNAHLQREVHESLPDRAANVATSVFNHEKSVVDCMDEHALKTLSSDERISMNCADETACNDCLAFQCLLDVATEAVLESSIHVGESKDTKQTRFMKQNEEDQTLEPSIRTLQVDTLCNGEMINKATIDEMNDEVGKCEDYLQDKTKDQINVRDEGNSDSSNEWDEGSSAQVGTENESSDPSDESGCQRRRPLRLRQNALKDTVKDNVFPVEVKKARSARPLLKLKASSSENCQTLVSTPCKLSMKAPGGKENILTSTFVELTTKENILTSTFVELTKNTASNWKQQIAAENGAAKKSDRSMENFQSLKLHKSQVFDLGSAGRQGIWSVPLQSPTLVHRRVIGLSRRHRPPSLHPYLANRDCR